MGGGERGNLGEGVEKIEPLKYRVARDPGTDVLATQRHCVAGIEGEFLT